MSEDDYYKILGVSRGASQAEIQKAYREQARKHHPDLNPEDAKAKHRFQQVQRAFEVLGDASKRELYDRYGSSFESMGQGRPQGGPAWHTQGGPAGGAEDIDFAQFFGEKFGQGQFGQSEPGGGWSDIFSQFRRGPGQASSRPGAQSRRRAQPQRGANLEHRLEIPFATVVTGGTVELAVRRQDGKVETISVKIPAGIDDGKKIRLRGQGEASATGGKPGDILIQVQVAPHPCYSRIGKSLIVKVPVTLAEAALGAKVDLPTPSGTITLTIPPCTSGGTKLRLKGRGIATAKGTPGDLLAEIQIVLPKKLDDQNTEWVKKLAEAGPADPRKQLQW